MKLSYRTRTRGAMLVALASSVALGSVGYTYAARVAPATAKPVTITWYYPATNSKQEAPPNLAQVEAAVDRISVPKIGVRVNLQPIGQDIYAQKMAPMLETGSINGIVWTSNWLLPLTTEIGAHAFMGLNALVAKDGRGMEKVIGAKYIKGAAVNGTIYAIPSVQLEVRESGVSGVFAKSDVAKIHYPLDLKTNVAQNFTTSPNVTTLAQLHQFLLAVHKALPQVTPLQLSAGFDGFDSTWYGYWTVQPSGWNMNNPSLPFFIKVGKYGKTPPKITLALGAQKQFIAMIHQWYDQGLINRNAGTMTSSQTMAMPLGSAALSGGWDSAAPWNGSTSVPPDAAGQYLNLRLFLKNGPLHGAYEFSNDQSTLNAIATGTTDPGDAVKLLNLVNTDPQVYNLLANGMPNVDYTKTGPNTITYTKAGSEWFDNQDWVMGDVFKGYVTSTQPGFSYKFGEQENAKGIASPAAGFTFNPTPVESQLADMSSVSSQWVQPLFNGVYSVSKFAQYEQQMQAAGQGQVLKAMQQQFDSWWKAAHS